MEWVVGHSLFAQERPPVLNYTGQIGANTKTVVAAQRAWAKYLAEVSHEKVLTLDLAGKVNVSMVLIPPSNYYRVDKYEVTQLYYQELMGDNPSHFKREVGTA